MTIIECAARDDALAMSVSKAARKIDVSRSTLYVLFNKGELAWVQIGRRRLVLISELERFLAAHRVERDSAFVACNQATTGTMADPVEELPPPVADADQGRGARAPARQLHRQVARRSRACRPGSLSGSG
jgi:excisionase family DNA binding protein